MVILPTIHKLMQMHLMNMYSHWLRKEVSMMMLVMTIVVIGIRKIIHILKYILY